MVIQFLALSLILSCKEQVKPLKITNQFQLLDDTVVNYNRKIIKTESQEIEDYIHRYQWKMQSTSSGLRYMIYQKGNGQKSQKGKIATILYTLRLLNGDLVYCSDKGNMKVFELGGGKVENGLDEGILLLRAGDQAKLIVPSHLGYGLLGDLNKIPANATLVYDVKLVEIKDVVRKIR